MVLLQHPSATMPVATKRHHVPLPGWSLVAPSGVKWITRYIFYAFIFSLPFETAYIVGGTTLPKLLGLTLAGAGLLQPHLCYRFPPKAFWWFALYLLIFTVWGVVFTLSPPNVPALSQLVMGQFMTMAQLLILFWISYNLLKQEQVVKGAMWALVAATLLLALLQLAGITSDVSKEGRVTAFEDNPNSLAAVLALGLLALFGVGYGREKQDWKGRLVFWLGSGILAIAIAQTGSRGAAVALVASLSTFFLRGKSLTTKLKFGAIGGVATIVLLVASYRIEVVRLRWEQTLYQEDTAGRDRIYDETIDMILERPLVGWGPVNHLWELGPRLGEAYRDEHNVYLWILAEVGLVGAIPFFAVLWHCWRSAWRGRRGSQGILPLVMLVFLLIVSLKGTLHKDKYFWVVLSLALASGSYGPLLPRSKSAIHVRYPKVKTVRPKDQVVKSFVRRHF